MICLTLEQLLELHVLVIQKTGGTDGLRDLARLEAAAAAQTQNVFGVELYLTLHAKAAALIKGIIAGHAFVDGNKRTGMLAGLTFLKVNNIVLQFSVGELENFAVKVAIEHLDISDIATWLQKHTQTAKR